MAIKQQRFDAGFALYQKALQLLNKKPKLIARILYNMGIGFVKWGKTDKGLKCFEKAAEQDPSFADAGHNIKILKSAPAGGPPVALRETADLSEAAVPEANEQEIPLMEITTFDGGEEEVELDDVLSNISKVG